MGGGRKAPAGPGEESRQAGRPARSLHRRTWDSWEQLAASLLSPPQGARCGLGSEDTEVRRNAVLVPKELAVSPGSPRKEP